MPTGKFIDDVVHDGLWYYGLLWSYLWSALVIFDFFNFTAAKSSVVVVVVIPTTLDFRDPILPSFSGLAAFDPAREPIFDPALEPDFDQPGLVAKRCVIGGIAGGKPHPADAAPAAPRPSPTGDPALDPCLDLASKLYSDPVFLRFVVAWPSFTLTWSSKATFSRLGVLRSLTKRNSGSGVCARELARDPARERRSSVML